MTIIRRVLPAVAVLFCVFTCARGRLAAVIGINSARDVRFGKEIIAI